MSTETLGTRTGEFLLSEANGTRSREAVTVETDTDRVLDPGQVLGTKMAAVVAADAGNTGDADVSAVAVTFGHEAQTGVYTLTCTAESANAGTMSVTTPDGRLLSALTVATAYTSDQINLTIPDGAEDWDTGDIVTVTVTGKAVPYSAAATDGSQRASGVLLDTVDASASDADGVAIVRDAEIYTSKLTGSSSTALAQLAMLGIVARS